MAENNTIKTVDFVPEFGLNGDLKKVSEYNFIAYNAKTLPILVLCFMEQGTNQLNPGMGAKDLFMSLPFSEENEASSIINKIGNQFSKYTNSRVSTYIDDSKTNWDTGEIYIKIEVEGVPGEISIGVNRDSVNSSQPFNIVQPSVFRG